MWTARQSKIDLQEAENKDYRAEMQKLVESLIVHEAALDSDDEWDG